MFTAIISFDRLEIVDNKKNKKHRRIHSKSIATILKAFVIHVEAIFITELLDDR